MSHSSPLFSSSASGGGDNEDEVLLLGFSSRFSFGSDQANSILLLQLQVMLNVLGCRLTYQRQAETNA